MRFPESWFPRCRSAQMRCEDQALKYFEVSDEQLAQSYDREKVFEDSEEYAILMSFRQLLRRFYV